MNSQVHAVKIASGALTLSRAYAAALNQFQLVKSASLATIAKPLTLGARLRSGGAGALVGGAIGAAKGFLTADPSDPDGRVTFKDRLRSAAISAVPTAAIGGALGTWGATAGQYGLNRQGLKNMFSQAPVIGPQGGPGGRGNIGEMLQASVFGSPVTAYNQYKSDLARAGGSHLNALGQIYKRTYLPSAGSHPAAKALQYAFTAGQIGVPAYQALTTDDPEVRKQMLARSAAGLITAPLTSQLGLAGTLAQQGIENLASRAVSSKPVQKPPYYDALTHGRTIAQATRARNYIENPVGLDAYDVT